MHQTINSIINVLNRLNHRVHRNNGLYLFLSEALPQCIITERCDVFRISYNKQCIGRVWFDRNQDELVFKAA